MSPTDEQPAQETSSSKLSSAQSEGFEGGSSQAEKGEGKGVREPGRSRAVWQRVGGWLPWPAWVLLALVSGVCLFLWVLLPWQATRWIAQLDAPAQAPYARSALRRMGRWVLPSLLEALPRATYRQRLHISELLAALDLAALPALKVLSRHPDWRVREMLVRAVARFPVHSPERFAFLRKALEDDHAYVQYQAIDGFARTGKGAHMMMPTLRKILVAGRRDPNRKTPYAGHASTPPAIRHAHKHVHKHKHPHGEPSGRAIHQRLQRSLCFVGDDENWHVRIAIVRAIEKVEPRMEKRVALWVGALQDRHAKVRRAAAHRLFRLGKRAVKPLVALLRREDDHMRYTAADILGRIGRKAIPTLSRLFVGDEDAAWYAGVHALKAMKGRVAPAHKLLCQSLRAPTLAKRKAAAQLLVQVPALGLPCLLRLRTAPQAKTRAAVAYGLGLLSTRRLPPSQRRQGLQALATLLQDAAALTRQEAAHSLASFGPQAKDALPILVQRWRRLEQDAQDLPTEKKPISRPTSRAVASSSLPAKGGQAASRPVSRAVASSRLPTAKRHQPVSRRASQATASSRPVSQAVAAAPSVVAEQSALLRAMLQLAPRAPATQKVLLGALQHPQVGHRHRASFALLRAKQVSVPVLRAVAENLKHPSRRLRRLSASVLGKHKAKAKAVFGLLRRLIQDKNPDLREAALHAFARIGESDARTLAVISALLHGALAQILPMQNPRDVQAWVETALVVFGRVKATSPEALGLLGRMLRAQAWTLRAQAARSIRQIGPAAAVTVPALQKALDDARWQVRRDVILALGAIGPQAASALPSVRALARDPNFAVQLAVRKTLPRLLRPKAPPR